MHVQMEICMFLGFINNRALEYRTAPPNYQKAHGNSSIVWFTSATIFEWKQAANSHIQLCVKRVWAPQLQWVSAIYTQLKMICAKACMCIKCVSVCVWLFKTKPQSPWHCHKTKNNSQHVKYILRNWSNVSNSYIYCADLWMHLNVCHPKMTMCARKIFSHLANWII